jgi:hypothetical protein
MRLLLDTHVFLWFISADVRLPAKWRDAIRDPENGVFLSVVSIYRCRIPQITQHDGDMRFIGSGKYNWNKPGIMPIDIIKLLGDHGSFPGYTPPFSRRLSTLKPPTVWFRSYKKDKVSHF